jgi:hypothetical protein
MKHLIERCEAEVDEAFTANDLPGLMVPAIAAAGIIGGIAKGAQVFHRDVKAANAEQNNNAESGYGRCADGYNMVDGKCVKAKGLGNFEKRNRIKHFFTGK